MLSFFKKKKDSERDKVLEEFKSLIAQTKNGKEEAQVAIGHGVNIANSIFLKSYSSPDIFRQKSDKEKYDYFKKFCQTKENLKKEDFGISVGFHFFGTYLVALVNNDYELEGIVQEELVWLSKKGEILGGNKFKN